MHRMTQEDRIRIEDGLTGGMGVYQIAEMVGFSAAAVYREVKRGSVNGIYNASYSQKQYEDYLSTKGREPIFSENKELAERVASLILEGMTPENISILLSEGEPGVKVATKTIYNAIERGLIPGVDKESLRKKSLEAWVSNGNIKLPAWVTRECGLKEGDKISFELKDGKLVIDYKKE